MAMRINTLQITSSIIRKIGKTINFTRDKIKNIKMIKKHIPNSITLLNLSSGVIAILLATKGLLQEAAIMVVVASVFDFFDGFAARLLHVKSNIGKELDSLSDMVSFGVAPGAIMYFLL
jgi:CDP-diacylglycerol--serine O-phosphatidyltransferase